MADIELLDLPELPEKESDELGKEWTELQIQMYATDYALANVEHHTTKLREEVGKLIQANRANAQLWESDSTGLDQAESRIERLEEVLRQVQQKLEEMAMIRGGHGALAGTYLLVLQALGASEG